MLCKIFNKFLKLLLSHLPPISQTIQVRRTERDREELKSDYELLNMDVLTDPQRLIFINFVQTTDAVYTTCQERLTQSAGVIAYSDCISAEG